MMVGPCGPCSIQYGSQCVRCPDGSTLPECADCVQGQFVHKQPWFDKRDIVSAVVTGVVTALVVGYITRKVNI